MFERSILDLEREGIVRSVGCVGSTTSGISDRLVPIENRYGKADWKWHHELQILQSIKDRELCERIFE